MTSKVQEWFTQN